MIARKTLIAAAAVSAFASAANAQVFINELLYDAVGTDGGKAFVEIYGPPGLDISGWELRSVEGTANQTPGLGCGFVNQTGPIIFPSGSLIGPDGFFVVADGEAGVTQVVCAATHNGGLPDLIVENADFENGPDESLQLIVGGLVLDAVQLTATVPPCITDSIGNVMGYGVPAPDVPGGFSLERYPAGSNTGNNYDDFRTQGFPSPGTSRIPSSMIFTNGSISATGGGATNLLVSIASNANKSFLVLASITPPTGNDPLGVPFDPITDLFIQLAVTPNPILVNFVGTLDSTGRVTATFNVPPALVTLPGTIPFYFAAISPVQVVSTKTNVATISLTP
jgi:hypothetical protein